MLMRQMLTPTFLTQIVRTYSQINRKGLDLFGTPIPTPDIIVNIDEIIHSRAVIRHSLPGGTANTLQGPGLSTKTFQMPRIFSKVRIKIADLYKLRMVGKDGSVLQKENFLLYIQGRVMDAVKRANNTKEAVCWSLLLTGKATIEYEDGVTVDLDLQFDAANQIVDAGGKWSTTSYAGLAADAKAVKTYAQREAGGGKIRAYCGENVMTNLANNEKLQHGQGSLIRDTINANGDVSRFLGIDWEDYFAQYENLAGSMTSHIPDDKVVFITDLGSDNLQQLTGPAEAEMLQAVKPDFKLKTEGEGMISWMEIETNPASIVIYIEQYYLMLIKQIKSIYVLDTNP